MKVSTNRIAEGKIYLSAINHGCTVLLLEGRMSDLAQISAFVQAGVQAAMSAKTGSADDKIEVKEVDE